MYKNSFPTVDTIPTTNLYICPDDGYLIITTGTTSGDLIQVKIYDAGNTTTIGSLKAYCYAGIQDHSIIYLKKGCKLLVTASSGTYVCEFKY